MYITVVSVYNATVFVYKVRVRKTAVRTKDTRITLKNVIGNIPQIKKILNLLGNFYVLKSLT